MDWEALMDEIVRRFRAVLHDDLVGVYVHGSIAIGCFVWERSDIDFIAVVDRAISRGQARALIDALLELGEHAPPKGIEMSVVLLEHCRRFVYPTPYELHFSNAFLDACRADPGSMYHEPRGRDPDLAAHFTVIRHVGVAVYGPGASEVFGDVPRADYLDSIWQDVRGATQDIMENPMYVVLNLCRVLAYLRDGAVLSKKSGGEWGIANLSAAHRPLIRAALCEYAGGALMPDASAARASFARDILGEVEGALSREE